MCQNINIVVNIDISGALFYVILDCRVPDENSGNSPRSVRTSIFLHLVIFKHMYICNMKIYYSTQRSLLCMMKEVKLQLVAFSCNNVVKSLTDYENNTTFWQQSWSLIPLWKSWLTSSNQVRFPLLQNIYSEVYDINMWQLEAGFWKFLAFIHLPGLTFRKCFQGGHVSPKFQC